MDHGPTDALVERFYEPLYRFARSLVRSESAAADLTQETFYLWSARNHQLRDRSKARSWLFTTLHREFLRQHRHDQKFPLHPTRDPEDEAAMTEPVPPGVVEALDGALVLAALRRVDERFRVPLSLFYLDDFTYQEIATMLELPIGTIMSRLSRGKDQLRHLLSDPGSLTMEAPGLSALPGAKTNLIPFRRSAQG